MDIKIDKSQLSLEQSESLHKLDTKLKQVIIESCSSERGRGLQVKYGTALIKGCSDDTFRLSHNASFELRGSHVIVDKVSTILKEYFSAHKIQDCLFIVNLTFSKRESSRQDETNINESERKPETNKNDSPVFIPSDPRYSFDKIVLPSSVFDDLMNAVKIIKYRDLIYNEWGYGEVEPYARCVINMYGPAGTGKTMCAHALAHNVGKKLLALNYSEIESKYLGEAAKNLSVAFETAKATDSIIFFDEADSFLGKRVQNVTQSSDQALNSLRSQMLILLEKFDGIVVFATNLVSNFDEAFMSRIQKHIRFELPNVDQICQIVKKQIPVRLPLTHHFSDEEFQEIGKKGEGLSGREIKNAIFEMYLQHASDDKSISFSPNDFANALASKVESNRQIEEEKNRFLKDRIMKKMAEKVQEENLEKKP